MNNKINWEKFSKCIITDPFKKYNIVYFHAFTGSYKNKSIIANQFEDCNFYAFDMPGHGDTKFESYDQISINYFCELGIQFILNYDIKNIILFGHSMGGGIVTMIANHPLIKDRVQKIILECPASLASLVNYDSVIKKLIPSSLEEMELVANELFYDPLKFFGNDKNYQKFLNLELERLKNKQYLKVILDKDNQKEMGEKINQGIISNDKKALLILGEEDKIIPAKESSEIFKVNSNYQISIIENTKHVPIAEKTNELLKTINCFIKD